MQAATVRGIFHRFQVQYLEFRAAAIDCLSNRTPVTVAQQAAYATNRIKCQHTCRATSTTSAARSIILEAMEALDVMEPFMMMKIRECCGYRTSTRKGTSHEQAQACYSATVIVLASTRKGTSHEQAQAA